MRGCNPSLQNTGLTEVGDKPPTLARWPLDWLPVWQLLNGAPLTASVCSSWVVELLTSSRAVGTGPACPGGSSSGCSPEHQPSGWSRGSPQVWVGEP